MPALELLSVWATSVWNCSVPHCSHSVPNPSRHASCRPWPGERRSGVRAIANPMRARISRVSARARVCVDGPQGAQWSIDRQEDLDLARAVRGLDIPACAHQEGSRGAQGLSYLLVPLRQPSVTVRPIRQMTGDAEFNETFFADARTSADDIVGAPGEGWKVAMATLGFERGVSTLGQQMLYRNELDRLIARARENGAARDPLIRQRLAEAHIGLKVMRYGPCVCSATAPAAN